MTKSTKRKLTTEEILHKRIWDNEEDEFWDDY